MGKISLYIYLLYASFACTSFYLPMYLQHRGYTTAQIGSIIAAGSLVAIVAQPFWGYVSDRRNSVKRVVAPVIACAVTVGMGVYFSGVFALTLAMMVAYMFFHSSLGPLSDSMSIQYAYRHRRHYGSIRLWGEVGIGMASLLLGFVTDRFGLGVMPGIYAGLSALALIALIPVEDARPRSAGVNFQAVGKLLGNRAFLSMLGVSLIVGIPHRMNDGMLGLFVGELGGRDRFVGYAWLAATFSSAAAMSVMGILLRKFSASALMLAAALLYAVRWLLYSAASAPEALVALQVMNALTFSMFFISAIAYMTELVPEELRSTGQAVFAAVFMGVGGIVGNAVGGWSMGHFGGNATYGAGAVLSFIGFAAGVPAYFRERGGRGRPGAAAGGRG